MKKQTILLTGCAGYIGSYLTRQLLSNGFYVIGVDNFLYNNRKSILPCLENKDFELHELDVRSSQIYDLASKCDYIIPLAALVGAKICGQNIKDAKEVNFESIKNLVSNLSKDQIVIYPNTNSGYGQTDGKSFVNENNELNPISVYGITKCDGEKTVLEHEKSVVFRLATVFGLSYRQRMDLMVNDFVWQLTNLKNVYRVLDKNSIKHNGKFEIFESHFYRNFVGIKDVCRAIVAGIYRDSYGHKTDKFKGIYNLGDITNTKKELAEKICDIINLNRNYIVEGEGKDPDQRNYLVSNEKILKTGFKFTHSLEDGILEMYKASKMMTFDDYKTMNNSKII